MPNIQDIYDEPEWNYGGLGIIRKFRKDGETISEHTVGKYMKEMNSRAAWIKLFTIITVGF